MNKNGFVLMVEDDHDDRFITKTALNELNYDLQIRFLSNGPELFAALNKAEKPILIILDYNLTPETGIQLLQQLKSNDNYKHIPVVILTENTFPELVAECYSCGASSVIKKPDTNELTKSKIDTFFRYWLDVAQTN